MLEKCMLIVVLLLLLSSGCAQGIGEVSVADATRTSTPTPSEIATIVVTPSSVPTRKRPTSVPPNHASLPTPTATLAQPCTVSDTYLQNAQFRVDTNEILLAETFPVAVQLKIEPCEKTTLTNQLRGVNLYASTTPFTSDDQLTTPVGLVTCYEPPLCTGTMTLLQVEQYEDATTIYVTLDGTAQLQLEVANEAGTFLSGQRGIMIPPADGWQYAVPFAWERYAMMDGEVFVAEVSAMAGDQNSAERLRHVIEKIRNIPLSELSAKPQRLRIHYLGGSMAIQTNLLKLETELWTGIRFLAQYDQSVEPITNEGLRYMFVGVSHDGKYALQASFAASQSDLLALEESVNFSGDWNPEEYFGRVKQTLEAAAPDTFSPTLLTLDNAIESLMLNPELTKPPEIKRTLSAPSHNYSEYRNAELETSSIGGRHLVHQGTPFILYLSPNCRDPQGVVSAYASLLELPTGIDPQAWATYHNADFGNEYSDVLPERHAMFSGTIALQDVSYDTETHFANSEYEETVDIVRYRLVGSDMLFDNGVFVPSVDIGPYACVVPD